MRRIMQNSIKSAGPQNVAEAQVVQKAINAILPDIKLFWKHDIDRWVVAQIRKNPGGLLLPGYGDVPSDTRPNLMYVIEGPNKEYRAPSQLDVAHTIKIGKEGREAIEKGADWLIDRVEAGERKRKEAGEARLRKKVSAIAPEMRRALRGDTFHGRVR